MDDALFKGALQKIATDYQLSRALQHCILWDISISHGSIVLIARFDEMNAEPTRVSRVHEVLRGIR